MEQIEGKHGWMRRRPGGEEFREFYLRMHDRAVATATRLAHDRGTGEDLAAEALARAYADWRKLRRHPNPDAWLMTVIGNLAIDQVRRNARQSPTPTAPPPDRLAEHATLRIDLADALEELTVRQRDVVLMRYLADMSETEVACALGLSNGAVKNHLHRATTKLRTRLGDDTPSLLEVTNG